MGAWRDDDQYADNRIRCPYFKRDGSRTITCEGFLRGQNTQLNFRRGEDKLAYQHDFCMCMCWRGCEIAVLAAGKYE